MEILNTNTKIKDAELQYQYVISYLTLMNEILNMNINNFFIFLVDLL